MQIKRTALRARPGAATATRAPPTPTADRGSCKRWASPAFPSGDVGRALKARH